MTAKAERLVEDIQKELRRLRGLQKKYETGAVIVKREIARGEAAVASGDVIAMATVCKALQDWFAD